MAQRREMVLDAVPPASRKGVIAVVVKRLQEGLAESYPRGRGYEHACEWRPLRFERADGKKAIGRPDEVEARLLVTLGTAWGLGVSVQPRDPGSRRVRILIEAVPPKTGAMLPFRWVLSRRTRADRERVAALLDGVWRQAQTETEGLPELAKPRSPVGFYSAWAAGLALAALGAWRLPFLAWETGPASDARLAAAGLLGLASLTMALGLAAFLLGALD